MEITNGGFLMAMAARAAALETDSRVPLSVTSHFLNPVTAGPLDISIDHLKEGRNLSMLRAITSRDGRSMVHTTAVLDNPARKRHETTLVTRDRPEMPSPDACVPVRPAEDAPFPPPMMDKVEVRLHPDDAAGFEGAQHAEPRVRGWFRLGDGEPLDAYSVLLASDAFPPAIFISGLPIGWTPTVDLSVQIRNPKPEGWLHCEFFSRFVTDGLLEEDGEIWDESGRLVALSRQLALVPRT